VVMDAGHLREALGQGFHVIDPDTGITYADCPGLVVTRSASPQPGSSSAQSDSRDNGDHLLGGSK
jgi:hypothetical protein